MNTLDAISAVAPTSRGRGAGRPSRAARRPEGERRDDRGDGHDDGAAELRRRRDEAFLRMGAVGVDGHAEREQDRRDGQTGPAQPRRGAAPYGQRFDQGDGDAGAPHRVQRQDEQGPPHAHAERVDVGGAEQFEPEVRGVEQRLGD
jgi:hypothetical protein